MSSKTAAAKKLLCPEGNEILFIEYSSNGIPHSIVTESDTYDVDKLHDGSVIYHSSGSGMRNNSINVGRLVKGYHAKIWAKKGVRLTDDKNRELTDKQLKTRGYSRIQKTPKNPWEAFCISHGDCQYCHITEAFWDDNDPSPYQYWDEENGNPAGCGNDELKDEHIRQGISRLCAHLSAKQISDLRNALYENPQKRDLNFQFDYSPIYKNSTSERAGYKFEIKFETPKGKQEIKFATDKNGSALIGALYWLTSLHTKHAEKPAWISKIHMLSIKAGNALIESWRSKSLLEEFLKTPKGKKLPAARKKQLHKVVVFLPFEETKSLCLQG